MNLPSLALLSLKTVERMKGHVVSLAGRFSGRPLAGWRFDADTDAASLTA